MKFDPNHVALTINGKEIVPSEECALVIPSEKKLYIDKSKSVDEKLSDADRQFKDGSLCFATLGGYKFEITEINVNDGYVSLRDPLGLIVPKPH